MIVRRPQRGFYAAAGLVLVLSAMSLSSSAIADGRTGSTSASSASLVDGGLVTNADDAPALASMWGVGIDQARTILGYQDLLDTLNLGRLDPNFVEVQTTPSPVFRIQYLSTGTVPSVVRSTLDAAGLLRFVDFKEVPYSTKQLRSTFEDLRDANPDVAMDGMLDTMNGRVVVSVVDLPAAQRSVDATTDSVPVAWEQVDQLARPTVSGGRSLSSGCTGGFVVENAGGNRGVSTAGHCSSATNYDGNISIQSAGSPVLRDNYDVRWHDNPAVSWGASFYSGFDNRAVTGVRSRADMNVGDAVCKYGVATGPTCGSIYSKSLCPSYVTHCASTFIGARAANGSDMVQGGDSGGPVYAGNTALGLVSGETGSGFTDLVFMAQQYVNVLGVRVSTQ